MSVLLSQRAAGLQRETNEMMAEYVRARDAFAHIAGIRRQVLADFKQLLIDGANELSRDADECAVRTVIAIHHGDEDAAYAYARQCARIIRTVRQADDLYDVRA